MNRYIREWQKRKLIKENPKCIDCGKSVSGKGRRCQDCLHQHRRTDSQKALGRNRRLDTSGHILIKIDGKWIPEHRYVWEKTYQKIPPHWIVHHLDGIKTNNDPANLYACSISFHHSAGFIKVLQDRIRGLQKEIQNVKSNTHLLL